jgi:IS5 family transposase
MTMKLPSLFDRQDRLDSISRAGDPLVRLSHAISWEEFRPILSKLREKERKSPAGRKPFDVLLMFKTLVLQRLYNLSDHQVEFQIKDRLSFQRFLGLGLEDVIPDEKTIWAFREHMSEAGLEKTLFAQFERFLQRRGLKTKEGSIVDATLVEVPIRRDSKEDNDMIKAGEVPPSILENPNVACQKDLDARWTKKHGKSYFGYKNHVRVDAEHKLIREYEVTPAHVHDSQVFENVLKDVKQRHSVYADNAYANAEKEERLDKERGIYCLTCQRGADWKWWNTLVARTRSRVEHVFGWMVKTMGGKGQRAIGLRRNRTGIGLTNLVYNMSRYSRVYSAPT